MPPSSPAPSYGSLEPSGREILNPVSASSTAGAAANGVQQASAAEVEEAGGAAPSLPPPQQPPQQPAIEELYLATLHILDALENRGYHRYRRMGPWAQWATRMYRSTLKRWSSVALLGLLALAFVERPQWCRDRPAQCEDTALYPRCVLGQADRGQAGRQRGWRSCWSSVHPRLPACLADRALRTEQWFIGDLAGRAVQAALLCVLWLNYAFLVVAFRSSLYSKTRGK